MHHAGEKFNPEITCRYDESGVYDVANSSEFHRRTTRRLNWATKPSVYSMTDDYPHIPRPKGRSASICAAGSMEAIPTNGGGTPDAGTPQSRRRRPAARSQSARLTNTNRSIRRRAAVAATTTTANGGSDIGRNHYKSEPKLADVNDHGITPDVSPNIRRKGSTRRGTSVHHHHRKSTAFLDVPDSRGGNVSQQQSGEEDENSYRLRSFSFTSKGEFLKRDFQWN